MKKSKSTLRLAGSKSTVRMVAAVYRGLDGTRVLVDFDGGRVPAYSKIGYVPEVNESVWVEIIDGVAFMLGPTVPRPASGVVASPAAGGLCTVTTSIGTVTASVAVGVTLTVGQTVKLYWADGAHVVAVIGAPAAKPVPAAPPVAAEKRTRTFTAIDSGSAEVGNLWWTNDVYSSASNRGLWFYGSKIRDTLPSDADILSAQIYLPRPKKLLGARPFGRHGYASKPGSTPSISATSTLGGTSGWVSIPTSLVDHLKSNVGGLGFDIGGFNIWPGVQADAQAGALRVTYQ